MILSHDGHDAYVADKESCDLREIDTATFRVVGSVRWPPADGCPFGLADGPNDDVVYTVTGNDHTIDQGQEGNVFGAVNFRTSQVLLHSHVGSDPVTLAISPSGWAAYVVDADLPLIAVVNPATGATTSTFGLPQDGDAAGSIAPSTLR
jgi:DNA-binding beta-propeller fold protein YncE